MAMKNKEKRVKPEYLINCKGNWNYKDKTKPSVYTKPICVIELDEDEFVFKHDDLFKILEGYHQADLLSIKMIENKKIDTGGINHPEKPLTEKIKDWLVQLETEEENTPDHNPKDWDRNICEHCGKGHLYCEGCKTYTWKREDKK